MAEYLLISGQRGNKKVATMGSQPLLTEDKGIILAADVQDIAELNYLLSICSGYSQVVAIKIGVSLVLQYGLRRVIDAVREVCLLPIIYDHQKAGTDIPATGKSFAKVCAQAGVNGVIFFPLAGPETLRGFVLAAFEYQLTPIVGLVMTHPRYLSSEGGYMTDDSGKRICNAALELGVTEFVMPGTRLKSLKDLAEELRGRNTSVGIMMPGIGTQGGSINDAFDATDGNRRYAIIGSAIYGAKDPREALHQFVEEVRQ